MKFADLNLHPLIAENLHKIGFEECTAIQDQAIPWLRQGRDLAGLAQTGTGKTGAFLIPLVDRLLRAISPNPSVEESPTVAFKEWKRRQFILVLVPTRELAEQVYENAKRFVEGTEIRCVSIYGGTAYDKQVAALKAGAQIVIATPGRLIDLYKEHLADLGLVRAVVFDEADRMFDMGFKDDMRFILRRIPRDRQFLVFSATLNFDVLNVAYEFGAEPIEINISRDQPKADNVKDHIVHLGGGDKPQALLSLLKKLEPRQAIIFSNFKHNVDRIARFLSANGIPAVGISSLLSQAQRNRVMAQFKGESDRNILVATDLAARGLDILGVDLVLNYELPDDPENYVHRIGRTGRAGQTGTAYSLVSDRDVDALQRIEEYLKHKLETEWLDDADLVKEFSPFPREESRKPFSAQPRRPSDGDRHRDRRSGRHGDRKPRRLEGQQSRSEKSEGMNGASPSRGGDRSQRRGHGSRDNRHKSPSDGRTQSAGRSTQSRVSDSSSSQQRRSHQNKRNRRGQHARGGASASTARATASPNVAQAGIKKKVSGFFKKLIGK